MTDKASRSAEPDRTDGGTATDGAPGEPTVQDRKIARGRQFYENVGTFRDVFKILLVVVLFVALVIYFAF